MSIDLQVANPKASYQAYASAIDSAIQQVLDSGFYVLGDNVSKFERSFADYCQSSHGVGVGSGTDALALALSAVGVGRDDEVITVSHTAVATVAAIEQIGAVPVFVDIDSSTRCMDPAKITAAITERTKALLPVHIYGQMADMPTIMRIAKDHQLFVIEDCAQAHGAELSTQRAGSFGDAAAFSFYPTKNLGCMGDGGAVVTSSDDVYQQLMMLREYGWQPRFISKIQGVNSRLDEMQAAILNVKLDYLDQEIARRNQIANLYNDSINANDLIGPNLIPDQRHAMHLYVLETPRRDEFSDYMKSKGIATALHYPAAVHQQPAYLGRVRGAESLGNTEQLYKNLVTLPMYPQMTDEQVKRVCDALNNWSMN